MTEFPLPPSDAVDWQTLGTKFIEVNGHVESTYSKATGSWTPIRFVANPYMCIHGMAPALNYGQQALEGLKAFRGPGDKEIAVFRPHSNALRMQHSADVVSMPRVPVDMFVQACRSAVAHNAAFIPPHDSGGTAYIRPQLYGSSPQLVMSPPNDYTFCVFITPVGGLPSAKPVRALILTDFDRSALRGTGNAKLGGNYAPVLRWSEGAKKEGYGITLHLDSAKQEEIDEFSTAGFIGVKYGPDKVTLIVPDSKCIIESVTSDSTLKIAQSFGWKTEKRPIKYAELGDFDEVMAAGTFLNLVPILSLTRRTSSGNFLTGSHVTSDSTSETVTYTVESQDVGGPVYQKLLARLRAIQRLQTEDEFDWRFVVSMEDQVKCPVSN